MPDGVVGYAYVEIRPLLASFDEDLGTQLGSGTAAQADLAAAGEKAHEYST